MKITEKLQAISIATNGNVYDANFEGGTWMMEAVETHETIEQFIESSKNWAECCKMQCGTIAGFPFVVWKNMQIHKGAQRRSMAVIDLGDVRFAIDAELGDFVKE